MMVGFHKQLQILCKCSKNAVIASQSADWRGNPFPLYKPILQEHSETYSLWDTDFRVGAKHLRRTLFAQTQAPAQPLRSLDSATGGAPLRPASLCSSQ